MLVNIHTTFHTFRLVNHWLTFLELFFLWGLAVFKMTFLGWKTMTLWQHWVKTFSKLRVRWYSAPTECVRESVCVPVCVTGTGVFSIFDANQEVSVPRALVLPVSFSAFVNPCSLKLRLHELKMKGVSYPEQKGSNPDTLRCGGYRSSSAG